MKVLSADNPDHGLEVGLNSLAIAPVVTASRNGPVARFDTPVTTIWTNPLQRVSFNPIRDCNPTFHLVEALWMLAGRDDVALPSYYAANIASYSDDGETLHGAYGKRWRSWFGYDQLRMIIDELKRDPSSRRCVLQMWDGALDLEKAISGGKDVPCNAAVFFDAQLGKLDMTVVCRSNDFIWGTTGANVVHFSMLLEYVSLATGIPIGTYYQMSNNLHVYTDFEISKRFMECHGSYIALKPEAIRSCEVAYETSERLSRCIVVQPSPLAQYSEDFAFFDEESRLLLNNYQSVSEKVDQDWLENSFLRDVAYPMMCAFNLYKKGSLDAALELLVKQNQKVFDYENDWLTAGEHWLNRRIAKRKEKANAAV